MSDVRALIPQAQLAGQRPTDIGLWFAKFVKPAPALVTDLAWVKIPEIDANTMWGPCRWMPRIREVQTDVASPAYSSGPVIPAEPTKNITVGRILLPLVNDEAIVAFDNRRDVWVISWWPI